jgi:putative transposase
MNENPLSDPSAWRSRGYLPHFDQPDLIQSITIRLSDAVPLYPIEQWKRERSWSKRMPVNDPRRVALRKQIETCEDAGYGACCLGDARIAQIVEWSLLRFDGERYRLLAWCIMPNHSHSILEIWEGWPLDAVLHSLKSYSAHKANEMLSRSGKFWFREYHDRYVRDAAHFAAAGEYVENNPVKAKLVPRKGLWRWSRAWRKNS